MLQLPMVTAIGEDDDDDADDAEGCPADIGDGDDDGDDDDDSIQVMFMILKIVTTILMIFRPIEWSSTQAVAAPHHHHRKSHKFLNCKTRNTKKTSGFLFGVRLAIIA